MSVQFNIFVNAFITMRCVQNKGSHFVQKKKKLLSKFARRNWASFKNEIFDRLIKSLLASVITD